MLARPPLATLHALAALVMVSLSTGCTVVGLQVQNLSARQGEARNLAAHNGDDRAAALLKQAVGRGVGETEKISDLVEAIRLTNTARPGSAQHQINQTATETLVSALQARQFAPVTLRDGKTLSVAGGSDRTMDPRSADELVPASALRIERLRVRATQGGAGAPYVVRYVPSSPHLSGQPGITPKAGITEAVTAVLHSDRGQPQLVFYRTSKDDDVVINGRRAKLAADFTAPLAYMLSKGRNRSMDIRSLIRTDLTMDQAGLFQFSPYDPDKIPVVFVHGLMSRPETWVPAVNDLLADEKIRERYQFWFFLYPTGLPVWATAAKLREEMDRFRTTLDPRRANPNLDRMVMVGHSMGGLVSGLQIRTGGKHLWQQFMNTPPEKLDLTPQTKERLLRIINFGPRNDVGRVVFFSTPHRGSDLAVNPFAEFFARLVRLPFTIAQRDMITIRQALRQELRELFVAPANSIVFLRARSPLLAAILNLPMKPSVPYHSIIGDRGKGDAPNSSDGVVPYWSSHLKDARSEKIVPSGHGSHENPEGIAELARILRQHCSN